MSRSRRAEGRLRDLRETLLARLRSHGPLIARLEQVETVDDGTSVIMPAPILDIQHRSGGTAPPDIALALMAVTASSIRENRQERKNHTVQTDIQIRERTLKRQGVAWLDDLHDESAAIITSHDHEWTALGATGGTPEPLWDESLNRYRSVARYDLEHWG